jgi:uncharacterized membrane protein
MNKLIPLLIIKLLVVNTNAIGAFAGNFIKQSLTRAAQTKIGDAIIDSR